MQPNAEDQARGLKPGLGATTMAINGAIGLNLTLLEFYTLALQSVDRVQATAEQVSTGRRLTKGMITSAWVFCNEKYQSLIQKGMITSVWVFCN